MTPNFFLKQPCRGQGHGRGAVIGQKKKRSLPRVVCVCDCVCVCVIKSSVISL